MLEEHLGGHNNKTHLDEGALEFFYNNLNCRSMLDIGCGPGGMVELAEEMGYNSLGIDGDYTLERYNQSKFVIHDFTKGPAPVEGSFDLAWSVEFVEHVYEKYIPNYIQSFQKCKYALITYAPPGWDGHHHVNLQDENYWINVFESYGFKHSLDLTTRLRDASSMNMKRRKKAFVKNRGLVFINES